MIGKNYIDYFTEIINKNKYTDYSSVLPKQYFGNTGFYIA
jgi:hypothetical protein